MGKSNWSWTRRHVSAISLATVFATLGTAPALAQSVNTGLLGDMGGLRSALGKYGITLGITDSENLLGNLAGGIKRGSTMQGVTTGTLEIDTGKAFNLQGGTFHITALQLHGQPLSEPYLDDLQAAVAIG